MKKNLSISLLPGDGIGQEISIEAKKILNWIDQNTELELDCFEELVGGASIDKHQTPLHDKTLEKIRRSDAIILGAVGGPKWEKHQKDKKTQEKTKTRPNRRKIQCFGLVLVFSCVCF